MERFAFVLYALGLVLILAAVTPAVLTGLAAAMSAVAGVTVFIVGLVLEERGRRLY